MRSLKDLIDEKSQSEEIQISRAVPRTQDEVKWLQHKQLIKSLSANYLDVLTAKLAKDPENVKNHKFSTQKVKNVVVIDIDFPELSEDFETVLSITEVEGVVQRARYLAFKNSPAEAFVRQIVG